jgi:pentatricopeptide repeat protein
MVKIFESNKSLQNDFSSFDVLSRSTDPMFHALLRAMKDGKNREGAMEVVSLMRSDGIEVSSEVYEDATAVVQEAEKEDSSP